MDRKNIEETNKNIYLKRKAKGNEKYFLTMIDDNGIKNFNLSEIDSIIITFGRSEENDIVVSSNTIGIQQGYFEITEHGIMVKNTNKQFKMLGNKDKEYDDFYLSEGSFVKIVDSEENRVVTFILSIEEKLDEWKIYHMRTGRNTIGSGKNNDIILPAVGIEKCHTVINYSNNSITIEDQATLNGTFVNGVRITTVKENNLKNLDVMFIGNSKIIISGDIIAYQIHESGAELNAIDIVKRVKVKFKEREISSHINMNVHPSEFVAFVGGSGAGKSTFMKCISGIDKPTSGRVYLNGEDLYENYESLKYNIGYVPQEDIVYSNLTLYDMLKYSAKLRMPDNATIAERKKRIEEVLEIVELTDQKNTYIRQLSGGQRKRASIATELIADPELFFLDEPTSGLDPGTERSIMRTLKEMTKMGKTIILVTHNTLNLHLCDKVAFFGKGGVLCFYGRPQDALKFFGVDDFVDIYNLIADNLDGWKEKYENSEYTEEVPKEFKKKEGNKVEVKKKSFIKQLFNLIKRYTKLILNDRLQVLLLLVQAPIISFLVSMVVGEDVYVNYKDTQSVMFCLVCASIWLGLLNSVQEICKERVILQKEYMADLKLSAYLLSKFIVQLFLAFVQATLLVVILQARVGKAEEFLWISPFWDVQIIAFLTIFSSASLGLFISSIVKKSNIAMSTVPIMLVPQLVFSGVLFKLEGITEFISNFVLARWSIGALGSTVNLNDTIHPVQLFIPNATVELEDYYTFTLNNMFKSMGVIALMSVVLIIMSAVFLRKNIKKDM